MGLTLKYQGRQQERNDNGYSTTLIWTGTQEECESFGAEEAPGSPGENGTLESVRIYQDAGNIWNVERRYTTDQDGNFTTKPNVVYGKKSAQLRGAMLSIPIEQHKKYRANWNYFLASAPGVTYSPEWWLDATDPILTAEDAQKFAWIKSPSEAPVDNRGKWNVTHKPTYPGVNSYDVAVYTVTETAKFSSAKKAGQMIASNLNRIGRPEEDFGLTKGGFNWKCDDATVSYNGRNWFATLTWTRSGDNRGWIQEIYGDLS